MANASQFPSVSFVGFAAYTPEEFDRSDLFPHDGAYQGKIVKATPGKSKAGNGMITLVNQCTEEGAAHGKRSVLRLVYTGAVESGRNQGRLNVERLWRELHKLGLKDVAAKLDGKEATAESVCAKLQGVDCVFEVKAEAYEGRWSSSTAGYAYKDQYTPSNRTALPPDAKAQLEGRTVDSGANGTAIEKTTTPDNVSAFM